MGLGDMNISSKGLEGLIRSLDKVSGDVEQIASRGVYVAAGAIADEVKSGLQSLPVQNGEDGKPPYAPKGEQLRGVTSQQKQDLIDSMGIARFREENGVITTSIGFHGTGSTTSKKYPGGIPNRTLMRGVESGTSFRRKTPVIRPAVNRVKNRAVQLAAEKITEELKKEL